MLEPAETLRLVARLAAVAAALSSLEVIARPRQLADRGLMSWPVSRLRWRWMSQGRLAGLLHAALRYPNFLSIVWLRLFVVLALFAVTSAPLLSACAAVLCGTLIAQTLRSPFGLDGADQMMLLIFGATSIAFAVDTPVVFSAALWFVALQALLSYLTAGLSKAVSPQWRNGQALTGIFANRIYGHRRLFEIFSGHRQFASVAEKGIFSFQIMMPLVLVLPQHAAIALLGCGVFFHLAIAVFMGLNTFLWAFLATYPAIYACAGLL